MRGELRSDPFVAGDLRSLARQLAGRLERRAKGGSLSSWWAFNEQNQDERSPEDRKRDALALVEACRLLDAVLGDVTAEARRQASDAGASFAEIGTAAGITRQAARQSLLREHMTRLVDLSGGPRNGEEALVRGDQRELIFPERAGFWDEGHGADYLYEDDPYPPIERPWSKYEPKYGHPDVWEFVHLIDARRRVIEAWDARPRVHQLAGFLHLDPAEVLLRAHEISPAVRFPRHRLNDELVWRLCDYFDPSDRRGWRPSPDG